MLRPSVQSVPLLVLPSMSLLHARHAAPRAAHVVEHSLGHFEAHTQPLQTSGHRAAEIVKAPRLDLARHLLHLRVKAQLGLAYARHGVLPVVVKT